MMKKGDNWLIKPSIANFSCRTLYGSYPMSVMFLYCLIGSYPDSTLFVKSYGNRRLVIYVGNPEALELIFSLLVFLNRDIPFRCQIKEHRRDIPLIYFFVDQISDFSRRNTFWWLERTGATIVWSFSFKTLSTISIMTPRIATITVA